MKRQLVLLGAVLSAIKDLLNGDEFSMQQPEP
jgi:hypothetical protein